MKTRDKEGWCQSRKCWERWSGNGRGGEGRWLEGEREKVGMARKKIRMLGEEKILEIRIKLNKACSEKERETKREKEKRKGGGRM